MVESRVQQAPRLETLLPVQITESAPLDRSYHDALGAMRGLCREVEAGQVPDAKPMIAAAKTLASAALRDPVALLGLAISKDSDGDGSHHSVNVGVLAMALAAAMGQPLADIEDTGIAGFLHDLGKTKIDGRIVSKPGKLTDREFDEMKRHPEYGALLVRLMEGVQLRVADGVLGHHIRFDRGGYPEWARGRPFGVMSGIVAVADCYDATTTPRAYQPQMQPLQALQEIRSQCGASLDGEIVAHFIELVGLFPAGSLVRLDSEEIAVVITPSSDPRGAATVQVVVDCTGRELAEPVLLDLEQSGTRISGLADPLLREIDPLRNF